jgi:integrase
MLVVAKKCGYIQAVFERKDLSLPRESEWKESRFFDGAQIRQIIATSEEPFATIFAVLACTGIRAGEGWALKVADIDFEQSIIRIRRTLDEHTRETHAPK